MFFNSSPKIVDRIGAWAGMPIGSSWQTEFNYWVPMRWHFQ